MGWHPTDGGQEPQPGLGLQAGEARRGGPGSLQGLEETTTPGREHWSPRDQELTPPPPIPITDLALSPSFCPDNPNGRKLQNEQNKI